MAMAALTMVLFCLQGIIGSVVARPLATAEFSVIADFFNHGGEVADGPALLRDTSIHSINDLQRDFMLESALVLGGQLHLDSNLVDPIPARAFLTAAAAAKVPALSESNIPAVLAHFRVAPASDMAAAIGTSAFMCGNPALPGEARSCPLSLEAMRVFVKTQLGNVAVEVVGTSGAPKVAPADKTPVTIVGVRKGSLAQGALIVVCHHIDLPSRAYYCHSVTGTKVIEVDVKDSEGAIIKGAAVCHMDTSMWLSSHPAFAALRIPKGATACHMLVENDLVFAPASKSSGAGAE